MMNEWEALLGGTGGGGGGEPAEATNPEGMVVSTTTTEQQQQLTRTDSMGSLLSAQSYAGSETSSFRFQPKISKVEMSWHVIISSSSAKMGKVGERFFLKMFDDHPELVQLFPFGDDSIDDKGKLKINNRTKTMSVPMPWPSCESLERV